MIGELGNSVGSGTCTRKEGGLCSGSIALNKSYCLHITTPYCRLVIDDEMRRVMLYLCSNPLCSDTQPIDR
jgi:hypothetical protein